MDDLEHIKVTLTNLEWLVLYAALCDYPLSKDAEKTFLQVRNKIAEQLMAVQTEAGRLVAANSGARHADDTN